VAWRGQALGTGVEREKHEHSAGEPPNRSPALNQWRVRTATALRHAYTRGEWQHGALRGACQHALQPAALNQPVAQQRYQRSLTGGHAWSMPDPAAVPVELAAEAAATAPQQLSPLEDTACSLDASGARAGLPPPAEPQPPPADARSAAAGAGVESELNSSSNRQPRLRGSFEPALYHLQRDGRSHASVRQWAFVEAVAVVSSRSVGHTRRPVCPTSWQWHSRLRPTSHGFSHARLRPRTS
jgi:hypothetical protein